MLEIESRQRDKGLPAESRMRPKAAFDLTILLLVFAASSVCIPFLNPILRSAHGFQFIFAMVLFQFCAEGLVPLTLMLIRQESFSRYGFTWNRLWPSLSLGLFLGILYDAAMSFYAHSILWVPLRRQPAIRIALAAGFPLNLLGITITVAVWGFLEGFFGIYFAKKINILFGHSGRGWLAPGVLAFALFNGGIHLMVGQGLEGFITSLASGYAIVVVPAITENAWGGTLLQALTNAVGKFK
ncbi:MAG: hypothetical protein P4L40_12190 [Terracidiphilus sp.]|nr:hypothetical protein [Terracidiphilus sp.]